jgi:hypothetical protein
VEPAGAPRRDVALALLSLSLCKHAGKTRAAQSCSRLAGDSAKGHVHVGALLRVAGAACKCCHDYKWTTQGCCSLGAGPIRGCGVLKGAQKE